MACLGCYQRVSTLRGWELGKLCPRKNHWTYVHVDDLAITLVAAHDSSHDDQLVLGDEVADASLVLAVAGLSGQVEFQSGGDLHHKKEKCEDGPHSEWRGAHGLGIWS